MLNAVQDTAVCHLITSALQLLLRRCTKPQRPLTWSALQFATQDDNRWNSETPWSATCMLLLTCVDLMFTCINLTCLLIHDSCCWTENQSFHILQTFSCVTVLFALVRLIVSSLWWCIVFCLLSSAIYAYNRHWAAAALSSTCVLVLVCTAYGHAVGGILTPACHRIL